MLYIAEISANSQIIQNIIFVIVVLVGAIAYGRGRVPAQAIKNLQISNKSFLELDKTRQRAIESLTQKIDLITKSHAAETLQLNKDISELQGQIKVYKELPLRELAEGIKEVVTISRDNANSNQQILTTLQASAHTLATDTALAAAKVEDVKTDLSHTSV